MQHEVYPEDTTQSTRFVHNTINKICVSSEGGGACGQIGCITIE